MSNSGPMGGVGYRSRQASHTAVALASLASLSRSNFLPIGSEYSKLRASDTTHIIAS